MSGGKRIDKSSNDWRHYNILRSVRDDVAIHPKGNEHGYEPATARRKHQSASRWNRRHADPTTSHFQ
jgi:hypothetical protein